MYRIFLFVLLAVFFIGCATSKGVRSSANKDRYVITLEEIQEAAIVTNAYDIVQNLRPGLLNREIRRNSNTSMRGNDNTEGDSRFRISGDLGQGDPLSGGSAMVYLDGQRYGTKTDMKSIDATLVKKIEYVPANEAGHRLGSNDLAGGAFLVSTK